MKELGKSGATLSFGVFVARCLHTYLLSFPCLNIGINV